MPQYQDTTDFYRMPTDNPVRDYLLLLRAQDISEPGRWWSAGTAFLISDRMALTAAHIFHAFERVGDSDRVHRQDRLDALGFENDDPWIHDVEPYSMAFDAVQFLPDGRHCRWAIDQIRFAGSRGMEGFDSDLAFIFLKPHPKCPNAGQYILDDPPRLQLFPPAIGQRIFLCGWPDNPLYENGELPAPLIPDDCFFISEARVEHISASEQSRERFGYPTFRSHARAHSGMSGGPILVQKPDLLAAVCGVHIGGDLGGISRHSVLWPCLSNHVDHPIAGRARIIHLIQEGFIDAPCAKYFSVSSEGFYSRIDCAYPDLLLRGTVMGQGEWSLHKTDRLALAQSFPPFNGQSA